MPDITCISIFYNQQECRKAVKRLQSSDCGLLSVSCISKQKFTTKTHSLFDDFVLFYVKGIGSVCVAGNLIDFYTQRKKSDNDPHSNSRVNPFEQLLFNIGVPAKHIAEYQQAVIDNKILLLVHDDQKSVEQACDLLHNDSQQVTVHLA